MNVLFTVYLLVNIQKQVQFGTIRHRITTDFSILQSCSVQFVLKMSSSLNNSVTIITAMNSKFTI